METIDDILREMCDWWMRSDNAKRKENDMNNKYELTDETKKTCGITFRRIRALRNIPRFGVPAGDFGGWIERESNLSQSGDAWVYGNAKVYGDADYVTFKNSWSSGRWFTYTRSNKKWAVGCFYGSGEELIKKAYADSELSGRCYEAIVRAVEAIEAAKAEAKGANDEQ